MLRGLNEYQWNTWYDLNAKCPICKEGFTLDDKVASFECSRVHWYHRSCMYKHVNETKDLTCGYCGKCSEWRKSYVFPDDEESTPKEEASAPAKEEQVPAEAAPTEEAPAEAAPAEEEETPAE